MSSRFSGPLLLKRVCVTHPLLVLFAFFLLSQTVASAQFSLGKPIEQNPLAGALDRLKQDAFVKAATTLLNDQLPIKLDAKAALPTVSVLPGGPFAPKPLALTSETMAEPLAPGDYTVNVAAFCTEYSVHRPGRGVAYVLAPLQGKDAGAMATLLWRGMQAQVPTRDLMNVTWGIQSGLTYGQMPSAFQQLIDRLIPEYKAQLSGDFLQQLLTMYQDASKEAKLPPLDVLLASMGQTGQLVLSAERQRAALLAADKSEELRAQTLFEGQESGVYTPVKAEDGPWTVRIPGVAYMRFLIQDGNLASNNIIEIRILSSSEKQAAFSVHPRFLTVSDASPTPDATAQPESPNVLSLLGAQSSADGIGAATGLIGYSEGQGAQALIPVLPPPAPAPQTPNLILTKATTPDAQNVVVSFSISGQAANAIHFDVYRSPTSDTAINLIASQDVSGTGSLSVGDHSVTISPAAGLPPNTAFPYVVVVATNNGVKSTVYFRKYLIGVISHGFDRYDTDFFSLGPTTIVGGTLPDWETAMATNLIHDDLYDDTIAFDWTKTCALRQPDMAVQAGFTLGSQVVQKLAIKQQHPGDVVDLHFIGHSRGTVVVTQALKFLATADPHFGGGYMEVTLLDPHPANDSYETPFADFERDAKGQIGVFAASAQRAVTYFQSIAVDPPVEVPNGVKKVEVWYQHTPAHCLTSQPDEEDVMNLWGMVGSKAFINDSALAVQPVNRTDCTKGIGHNQVPQVYETEVVESGTLDRDSQ